MREYSAKWGPIWRAPNFLSCAITVADREGIKLGMNCKVDGEFVLGVHSMPSIRKIFGKYALSNLDFGETRTKVKKVVLCFVRRLAACGLWLCVN